MRFTKSVVTDMIVALMDVAPDDATRAFIRDSVQINPTWSKRGTAYVGMGGAAMSVQYGGTGARCAVGYVYGIGVQFDLWDKVRKSDRDAYDKAKAVIYSAQDDLGVSKMYAWSRLGRDYAQNNFDSWSKSAGF